MFNFHSKTKHMDESLEEQRADLVKFPKELSAVCLVGEDCDRIGNANGEFGRSLTNPIPVNGPTGEIKYINRLKTSDGGLIFHRLGSFRNIDIYEVVSIGGKFWDVLYLDMYHPRRSTITPSDYTFSKFDQLLSRCAFGYCTNNFDPIFPFGMSPFIEKGLGGKSLVKRYEEVIKDRAKFTRPPEHLKKLGNIKLESRQGY